jgi:serine/threonine protein phosphatase PrpC
MSASVRALDFLQSNTKNKPNEDAVAVSDSKEAFVVADGVTRSVGDGKPYPSPSPAGMVSSFFCQKALWKALWNPKDASLPLLYEPRRLRSEEDIFSAFSEANLGIAELNRQLGFSENTDYFENDLAGCVAVLGVLSGSTLHYGYIGDCGLLVFDKDLNPIFLSDNNELGTLELFRDGRWFPGKKEKHVFMRKNFRNRPSERFMTYGVLTGEEEALSYVKTGSISLERRGDTAILFSDGIYPFIFDREFREILASTMLLSGEGKDGLAVFEMRRCIDNISGKLIGRVANLDDDKAFVAFQLA